MSLCRTCKLSTLCLSLGKDEALGRALQNAAIGYTPEMPRDLGHRKRIEHEVGLIADEATGMANCEPQWEIVFEAGPRGPQHIRVDFTFPDWTP